jgi:hypothetical protein
MNDTYEPKINMKISKRVVLAAAVCATIGLATQANAIQKHDPQFRARPVYGTSAHDPNMIRSLKNESGSPRAKKDWYARNVTPSSVETRDLAREIRYQNGSPRMKQDPSFAGTPVK